MVPNVLRDAPVKDQWLQVRPEPEQRVVGADARTVQFAVCVRGMGPWASWNWSARRFEPQGKDPLPESGAFAWLEITSQCNQRCLHCFFGDRLRHGHAAFVDVAHAIQSVASLPLEALVLSGGEPTLHPDFVAIVELAKQAPWPIRILTNGRETDPAVLRALAHRAVHVEIPVLGWGTDHDLMTGVPGSFGRTLLALARYRDAGIAVTLTTTLTRYAVSALPQMQALAQTLGIPFAPSALFPEGQALAHWETLVPLGSAR